LTSIEDRASTSAIQGDRDEKPVAHPEDNRSRSGGRFFGLRSLAKIAILAVVYFAAGKLGLIFAVVNPSASPVWPASGVGLAALLLLGPRVWPGLFLGAFLVNISASGHVLTSIGIAAGNTLEGLLGAYLVDRFNAARRDFERPGDVWRFFVLAGLVSTAVAATVGATSLLLGGFTGRSDYTAIWVTWWLGDAVGVLIVTPLILLWANAPRVRWSHEQFVEAFGLLVTIVLVGHVLFGGWIPNRLERYPLDFLCIPMFVWVAFRFGQREAATAVLILAGIAISGTVAGVGPFVGRSQSDSLLLLQVFLGLTAVLTLALAAVVSESRRGHEASVRMATIVKSSSDAIVAKTLDGTITSWNPAAETMFGYAADEALGRNITMIIPPDVRHEEDTVLAKIRRGDVVDHFETVRVRKDGSSVHVELTVSPVFAADGRIVGVSKIARDISDRMRLEDERSALLTREQEARADAEAGNRAKDEFLAILSHELRTPLNAVYGWARMMQAGKLDEETSARALDAIVRNANAQVQLIDDLLDVSRVINGKMRLDVRPTDVREVIDAAIDAVGPAVSAKGQRLERVLDPGNGRVNGDPGRLQQIVWNLVINAVKFTPPGGEIRVRMRCEAERVAIVVSDTGQGIPAHVLPFVFDRFRQWDSSSTRAHSGLGLGLALVKHLTELHRGTVSAESPGEGRGATFTVTLPVTAAPRLPSGAPSKITGISHGVGVRLDGLTVLAVDDDPDALQLASAILGSAGAVVKTCRTAADALAMIQSWRPAVLVSDIDMPGEDGYALIRKIRALDETRGGRTPAIALTAYGRTEDRVQTLSSGYSMHLPKPVDPDEFTTIVASVAGILRPAK
jgi:PAS domain S-box-containing protein